MVMKENTFCRVFKTCVYRPKLKVKNLKGWVYNT